MPLQNTQSASMSPIPDYGDLMTMQDFIACCQSGGFIDYDGHGCLSDGVSMSDTIILPSHIASGNYPKGYSHVVWFNK